VTIGRAGSIGSSPKAIHAGRTPSTLPNAAASAICTRRPADVGGFVPIPTIPNFLCNPTLKRLRLGREAAEYWPKSSASSRWRRRPRRRSSRATSCGSGSPRQRPQLAAPAPPHRSTRARARAGRRRDVRHRDRRRERLRAAALRGVLPRRGRPHRRDPAPRRAARRVGPRAPDPGAPARAGRAGRARACAADAVREALLAFADAQERDAANDLAEASRARIQAERQESQRTIALARLDGSASGIVS
jgi:hypothetical protein